MQKQYAKNVKKTLLMLGYIALAALLAGYSNLDFSKVIVLAMAVYFVLNWKWKKLSSLCVLAAGVLLCFLTIRYFNETMYPITQGNSSTANLQLTQLSIPGKWENHDMWISPIVNGKTVDLTYADEWCHAYFEEFAVSIQIGKEKQEFTVPAEDFAHLGEHYFKGTRDFFDENLMDVMYAKDAVPGSIYIATRDLAAADTVYVITDEAFNVYMMSGEMLERVLEANES